MTKLASYIFPPSLPNEPQDKIFNFAIPYSKIIQYCQLIDVIFIILAIPYAFQTILKEESEVRFMFWTCYEIAGFLVIRIGLFGTRNRVLPGIMIMYSVYMTMLCFLWFTGELFDIFNLKYDDVIINFFMASRKQYYYYLLGLNVIFNEKNFNIFMLIFRFFAIVFYLRFYGNSTFELADYLIDKLGKEKRGKDGIIFHQKRKDKKCFFSEEKGDSECQCPLDQPCEC